MKDLKTLTLGEIAAIESITGHSLEDQNQPRGKYSAALVMVLQKRKNPDYTLDDAYNMDASDAEAVINEYFGDAEDPFDQPTAD